MKGKRAEAKLRKIEFCFSPLSFSVLNNDLDESLSNRQTIEKIII